MTVDVTSVPIHNVTIVTLLPPTRSVACSEWRALAIVNGWKTLNALSYQILVTFCIRCLGGVRHHIQYGGQYDKWWNRLTRRGHTLSRLLVMFGTTTRGCNEQQARLWNVTEFDTHSDLIWSQCYNFFFPQTSAYHKKHILTSQTTCTRTKGILNMSWAI